MTAPLYVEGVGFALPPATGDPPHLMRRLQWQLVELRASSTSCGSCVCCPTADTVRRRSPVVTATEENEVAMPGFSCGCWMLIGGACSHNASTSFAVTVDEPCLIIGGHRWDLATLMGVCTDDQPPRLELHTKKAVDCSLAICLNIIACGCGKSCCLEGQMAPNPVIEVIAPLCPMDPRVGLALQAQQREKSQIQKANEALQLEREKANEALLSDIAFRVSRHILTHSSVAPALTQPALQAAILAALLSHPIIFLLFPPFTPVVSSPTSPTSSYASTPVSSNSGEPRWLLMREEVENDLRQKLGASLDLELGPFHRELCHLFDLFVVHQQRVALNNQAAADQITEMNREIQLLKANQQAGGGGGGGSAISSLSDGVELATKGISLLRMLPM